MGAAPSAPKMKICKSLLASSCFRRLSCGLVLHAAADLGRPERTAAALTGMHGRTVAPHISKLLEADAGVAL